MSVAKYFDYPSETVDYLSNVSLRYKYFYFANPKVASTSILRTLQHAEKEKSDHTASVSPHDRSASPLENFSKSGIEVDEVLKSDLFFRFTYVRNPFTRILSAYLDKIVNEPFERKRLLPELGIESEEPIPFRDFLQAIANQRDGWRDIHWATQSRLLQCNNIEYSFIGRFESFEKSFPLVLKSLGIATKDSIHLLPPDHATGAATRVTEFIGPKERDLILQIYESDFKIFRYGLDERVAHI